MKLIDLTGHRFGRLTAISRGPDYVRPNGVPFVRWECDCDCGKTALVVAAKLRNGHTQSCGCRHRDRAAEANTTHGATVGRTKGSFEYRVWRSMKARCSNPTCGIWQHYGGRGITVCDRWRDAFEAFLADMGPAPSSKHSIERNDVNGHYSPENCRWATDTEQNRNRRDTRWADFRGERRSLAEWAEILGIPRDRIRHRLNAGWPVEAAMSAEVSHRFRSPLNENS